MLSYPASPTTAVILFPVLEIISEELSVRGDLKDSRWEESMESLREGAFIRQQA